MPDVGDEVLLRGKIEEVAGSGDPIMVRLRCSDGNDIWVSVNVLYELRPKPGRGGGGSEPEYTFHSEIERVLDRFGQAKTIPPTVADWLKRVLIAGEDRAGPRPSDMPSVAEAERPAPEPAAGRERVSPPKAAGPPAKPAAEKK